MMKALGLKDILMNSIMKDSFRTFCKQVLSCEELIDLWTDIQNYKNIRDNEVELKVNTAHNIWSTYFVAGSIEVPEELHTLLVDNLDSGSISLYDEVQTLIEDDLKEEAYHLFIKDFIKHANSSSNNPVFNLNNNNNTDETISKLFQPIHEISKRRRNSLQQEQAQSKMNLSSNNTLTPSTTAPLNDNSNESPPRLPPAHTPPSNSVKRGVRIERLGDKIQVYGRSPTNPTKQDENASSLEEYKYKGPLIPPNQEIRATVADIDTSFIRSRGEKEQFTQVTCCEVSVNLLYQKIPIITQGSIEGMAEMAKKLYNLKDYLQTDNDSFVMDINSILTRCDRYSAHLQVENVESINNSRIIQMFKSPEKRATCCILKAQVVEESSTFYDYLVVFYDGNESYCLFHTFEKLFPKKGLRACVTYFENLEVMEKFLNEFLAPNEMSAAKLSNNRKYILKQLITLRKKEQELVKKYLNYRVSLQIEDSPIENIEKKLFMMEDMHRNRIEELLNKLKDIEGKIQDGKQEILNPNMEETENSIKENVLDKQFLYDAKDDSEEMIDERQLSPRKRNKQLNNNSQATSPQKSDIITEYFINRLSNIESEMNDVKNAYTKKIETVVENLSNYEKLNHSKVEKTISQYEGPDAKLIIEMKKEIEMMKSVRLQLEKDVNNKTDNLSIVTNDTNNNNESNRTDGHKSETQQEDVYRLEENTKENPPIIPTQKQPAISLEPFTQQEQIKSNNYNPQSESKFEIVSKVISDLKSELAGLKDEMNTISKRKYITETMDNIEKSKYDHEISRPTQPTENPQMDEVIERVNTIENYTYENMSNVKQSLSEEKKDRFKMFEALHVKIQSVEENSKDNTKETKEMKDQIDTIKSEIDILRCASSITRNSDSSSVISKMDETLDGISNTSSPSKSLDSNQIILIQNNLKKEITQQITQQVNQQINNVSNIVEVENVLLEYKNQLEIFERKVEHTITNQNFLSNNNQEEIEVLEKRVSLLENDLSGHLEKTVESKLEQINFVNKNLNQVVNIKVESLEEKLEHLKEFVHMKTREMELSALNIAPKVSTDSEEGLKTNFENDILIQNFISQLSNIQHSQSNYEEKVDLISKLYDSSWNKILDLSESVNEISNVKTNVEFFKQNTDNKVTQLQSSVKRIDNQIEYLSRRLQQVDQQKDEQHIEKMTLFINSLSSRVDQELRKMNEYFERKEVQFNDKFLELLTRERMLNMREQNIEEREDHFIKHTNNHSVNIVKTEKPDDDNLLLKQVQHHLNAPKVDYSLDSVLYPLSSVDPEVLKTQRITDPSERIANEFKDSFLLRTPETLFSTSILPSYSFSQNVGNNSSYVSILGTNDGSTTLHSNSTSPTSSTTSSYHPLLVTSSGIQTFDEDSLLKTTTTSSPSTPVEANVAPKSNRRSSGSQTYKTQFKEYKKEDNSIIRSPFRKYAEQKDSHLYSSYYF